MQKSKSTSRSRLGGLQQIFQHGDRPWQGLIIIISALVIILMLAIGGLLWVNSAGCPDIHLACPFWHRPPTRTGTRSTIISRPGHSCMAPC